MKILFLDSTHPLLENGLRDAGHKLQFDYNTPPQQLYEKLKTVEGIIIRSRMRLDEHFIRQAPQLKFIGRFGAGLENIDVPFAESKGITCLRVPEGNRDAVGEHALGMLLLLFNRLKIADSEVRKGIWLRAENTGIELQGKTVGIIGFGNMGSAFAEKLRGFGVRILAFDKYKTGYAPAGVEETDLATLFAEADIVSLHTPLTAETRFMINEEFINRMAKPFYLINTARGPIVETAALVAGLKSGKVLGACMDVLEYEKTSFENLFENAQLPKPLQYLLAAENVVLTPHIAGWSHESFAKMAKVMLQKIERL